MTGTYLAFFIQCTKTPRLQIGANGESEDKDLLKDPAMLKRLNEIEKMDIEDKSHILHVLDGFIRSVKLKNIAAL